MSHRKRKGTFPDQINMNLDALQGGTKVEPSKTRKTEQESGGSQGDRQNYE